MSLIIKRLAGFKPKEVLALDAIEQIQRVSGLTLPTDFTELYAEINGAKFDTHVIRNDTEDWICYSMNSRFTVIYHIYSLEELLYVYGNIKDNCEAYEIDTKSDLFFLNYMIPFTDVDATNPLCVVCEGPNIGKIYLVEWWFHHQNEFTIPFPQQLVADSLEDFINKMKLAE